MRDLAIIGLLLAVLPLCIWRAWLGILVWTWLGLMNPHRLSWQLDNVPVAMLVAGLTLIAMLFDRGKKPPPWNRELTLLAILIAYATMTNFFAWHPEAAWAYWTRVIKMVGMLFVLTMLIHGRQRIEALLIVVALSIGFFGAKGGLFTILTAGQHRVQGPEGTMIGGNTFIGLAMVMVLPLIFALARRPQGRWQKLGFQATALLTLLSIPFTYSRGALLGLAAIIPGIFPKLMRLVLFLPLLIPLAFLGKDLLPEKLLDRAQTIETYQEDNSAMQRIRAWTVSFEIAKERPLVGAGFDFEEYPDASRWWSYVPPHLFGYGDSKIHVAHSIYLSVLGYHGFIGLALFLAILLFAFLNLRRLERSTRDDADLGWISPYARALKIGLVGYMIAGAFLNAAYFDLFYLFVALSAIFQREVATVERARRSAVLAEGAPHRPTQALSGSAAGSS